MAKKYKGFKGSGMREILFRGKQKNGQWVYGDLFGINYHSPGTRLDGTARGWLYINGIGVTRESVGQYTGLTDKNGKKIFEGDILKVKRHLYKLVWTHGCLYAAQYNYLKGNVTRYCLVDGLCERGAEVIGNIYENPELLEELTDA